MLTPFVFFRREALQMPPPRVWQGLHPALELAAALAEPRRAARAHEKQTLPLQHLRERIRDGELTAHPHGEGKRNFRKYI